MEKNQYLNKALKEAEKVFKTIEPQRQAVNKIIPQKLKRNFLKMELMFLLFQKWKLQQKPET